MNEDEANVPEPQTPPPLADLNIPKGKTVAVLAGTLQSVQRFSETYPTLDVLSVSRPRDLIGVDCRNHVLIRLNGWESNPLINNDLLEIKFPNWRSKSKQCLLPNRPLFDPSHPLARTLAEAQRENVRFFSTPYSMNDFHRASYLLTAQEVELARRSPDLNPIVQGVNPQRVNDALDATAYALHHAPRRQNLIIAGSRREVDEWLTENRIPASYQYRYVCIERDVRGYDESNANLVLVGNWWRSPLTDSPYVARNFPDFHRFHISTRPAPSTVSINLTFEDSEVPQAIAFLEVLAARGMRQASEAIAQLQRAAARLNPGMAARPNMRSCRNCGYFVQGQNPVCNAMHDLSEVSHFTETECHDWAEPLRSELKITRVEPARLIGPESFESFSSELMRGDRSDSDNS